MDYVLFNPTEKTRTIMLKFLRNFGYDWECSWDIPMIKNIENRPIKEIKSLGSRKGTIFYHLREDAVKKAIEVKIVPENKINRKLYNVIDEIDGYLVGFS